MKLTSNRNYCPNILHWRWPSFWSCCFVSSLQCNLYKRRIATQIHNSIRGWLITYYHVLQNNFFNADNCSSPLNLLKQWPMESVRNWIKNVVLPQKQMTDHISLHQVEINSAYLKYLDTAYSRYIVPLVFHLY